MCVLEKKLTYFVYMRKLFPIVIILLWFIISCSTKNEKYSYIKISTAEGNIVLKLYNQTPKHRDNFIKLADSNFFDNQIFHRVIQNFVVQGGDPSTKNSKPDTLYGEKDSGYLIDAEFVDTLIHKRGALGMAREGEDINPEKKSSGSQFYIVKGKIFTNEQLDELEKKKNTQLRSKIYKSLLEQKIANLKITNSKIDSSAVIMESNIQLDSIWSTYPKFKLTQQQRKVYTTLGGLPHLDGNYTVFGEVIEGYGVVDKISGVNTDKNDRPLKDVRFKIEVVK